MYIAGISHDFHDWSDSDGTELNDDYNQVAEPETVSERSSDPEAQSVFANFDPDEDDIYGSGDPVEQADFTVVGGGPGGPNGNIWDSSALPSYGDSHATTDSSRNNNDNWGQNSSSGALTRERNWDSAAPYTSWGSIPGAKMSQHSWWLGAKHEPERSK